MKKIIFAFVATLCFSIPVLAEDGTGFIRGDVDLDGSVNISDVTALIDYLLSGQWPAEAPEPEVFTVNGVSFTMIPVEGGTFTMGGTKEQGEWVNYDELPVHEVTLSSFYIAQTEVTQELWYAVMGNNPSEYRDNWQNPVESVSWFDCYNFITELNRLTGKNFRLPTEAEWEFAARGGNSSNGYMYAGSNDIEEVAWYRVNSYLTPPPMPHNVATKAPNELGLYDMSGSVFEWCQDFYGEYSSEAQVDPIGPESGTGRVMRGGAWDSDANQCRVSSRWGLASFIIDYNIGLRLAL